MSIRQLLLALVLLTVPASALATGDCCRADDPCCAGEQPACPLDAAGECAGNTAAPTLATIHAAGNELPARLPAQRVDPGPVSRTATRLAASARSGDPTPSQRLQPLRN